VPAVPCRTGEVGELVELPPGVRPAERLEHGAARARGRIEAAEAAIRVGLQNAGITGQVLLGMLAAAVA
jgi:hypothetical protein